MRLAGLSMLVVAGLFVMGACGWHLRADWHALQRSQARFEATVSEGGDLRDVFVAYAAQDIHRANALAEGLGVLAGALLTGIGVHGICTLSAGSDGRRRARG